MRTADAIKYEYELWLKHAKVLRSELVAMNSKDIEDAFYCDLSFGTGGLRGVLGAGTNRMNVYTVAKASQGLANFIIKHFSKEKQRVAVSYDSRINSDIFAKVASSVFVANGLKVFLYPELMPVPCLSYATRRLYCASGIMITASHNPAQYNGYKVYNADGCQITTDIANEILNEIEAINIFIDVKYIPFYECVKIGNVVYIDNNIICDYIKEVKSQSVLFGDKINKNFSIVYSPLNGAGLKPVTSILQQTGFRNIVLVSEQEHPDGHFTTCPYPNPEIRDAMALGLDYCEHAGADLLLATDPDCDRCGIAVKAENGYKLLTGNEVGLLLLDYICSQRTRHNRMPPHPVAIKTIVTSDLAEKIADSYGVQTYNVLTGFKFIGELIGRLEQKGRSKDYIFGFEESCGYLTGGYVRDKDGVNAVFMICEMFAFYKTRGVSLLAKLNELYAKHGFCLNTLHSYEFGGSSGMVKMQAIMNKLREGVPALGNIRVLAVQDYLSGLDGLPTSDVLKFQLQGGCSAVVRPSGTEPKLKAYLSIVAESRDEAEVIEARIAGDLQRWMA